jgi:GH25 family lysozyme M1 (1,4-beta-N-acetylmuramidase)
LTALPASAVRNFRHSRLFLDELGGSLSTLAAGSTEMRTKTLLLTLAAVAALLVVAPTVSADDPIGVDVSNHQGKIAWAKIGEGIRFAFLKASESTDFVDAWYDRNRKLAKRQGIKVGAYHFARPGGRGRGAARADGRLEARFFDRVARPRRGELRPVLDLEMNGGLRPGLLIAWAKAFVKKTRALAGAKPMIYTSPTFWRTSMANTKWFANHGYKALWIAHWQVRRPNVPADNWAGHGWTFWQFTSCGRVRGIAGCVDKNRYNGRSFQPVKIR